MINAVDQLFPVLGEDAHNLRKMISHIVDKVGYGIDRTIMVPGYYNVSLPPLTASYKGHAFVSRLPCHVPPA
jgi:hypothetical protein